MPKFRKVTLLEEDLKRGELYVDILGFVYLGVSNKLCNPSQNIRHILFCITIRNFDNAVNDWNKLVNKFWRFQL